MHFFTIDEAEACLSKVERLLRKAQRLRENIFDILESRSGLLEVNDDAGFHYFVTENIKENKEFHKTYYQFYHALDSVGLLGVVVRDIDEGLVDFPFKFNDRTAFFSWQLGEDKIQFWHDGSGDKRQIVDLDKLFQKKDL